MKTMSPDSPRNEAIGADQAIALLNQGGREFWTGEQVRRYADEVYRRMTASGTSTAENEQAEGFRRTAYAISQARPSAVSASNCSNPRCIRYNRYDPGRALCDVCKKEFSK